MSKITPWSPFCVVLKECLSLFHEETKAGWPKGVAEREGSLETKAGWPKGVAETEKAH